MATTKTKRVDTFNGQEITSKSWRKINLTGQLLEHWNALKKAREAFETELVAAIRKHEKVTPAHDVRLGFNFGPSYVIIDKRDHVPAGAVTL